MTENFKTLFLVSGAGPTTKGPAAGKIWVLSRLNIANSGAEDSFSIQRKQGGTTIYMALNEILSANTHDRWNGIVLNGDDGDELIFSSASGNIHFVGEGTEVTP